MTNYELRQPERDNLAARDASRDHLSHTSLKSFLACQQQYAHHYESRLSPTVTKESLAIGRAFAHALELGLPEAAAIALRDQAVEEAQRAAGNPWVTAPDQAEVDVQATVAREAARAYLARYGKHDATREVELRARIRNPAVGGRYSLTHDLLARVDALSPDNLVMYEDKLVSQIPRSSFTARVALDRQVSIGAYLVWRCTGVKVARVHYRMTLKPAIRRRQNEAHEAFLNRIAEEYAIRPDHYLAEEVATRDESDFLRLEQELWQWAEQLRQARRAGVWPRNTGQCHEYGGCRFLALCAGEPGAHHQFRVRETRPQEAVAA